MRLEDMLVDAHSAYGRRFVCLSSLQAQSYFEEGNVQTLPDQIKRDLEKNVAAVDLDRLEQRIASCDRRENYSHDPVG